MEERNLLVDPRKSRRKKDDSYAVQTIGRVCSRQSCRNKPVGMGCLPPEAPLANPYVPFQQVQPPKYEAKKGLVRGTLFPGLDLPFQDMVNNKELCGPTGELQALGFAIQELALYLDTHRNDTEALELYRSYQKLFAEGEAKYVEMFGPLNHMQPGCGSQYEWLDDPWPWEFCGNR